MNVDKANLKALGESSGLGEWYSAGDLRYCDDKTGEIHGLHHDDSRFIAAASPATVLALLAEIERLEMENRSLKGSCSKLGAEHAGMSRLYKKVNRMQFEARQECDQFKAENEALRQSKERAVALLDQLEAQHAELKAAVKWLELDAERYRAIRDDIPHADLGRAILEVQSAGEYDCAIDAAMAKEASRG